KATIAAARASPRRGVVHTNRRILSWVPLPTWTIEGNAMNWKLYIAMSLVSVTFLAAEGPKGTEPRPAATAYPSHAEINGIAVGAALLTADEARRLFVSDVNRCCLVVEVAFYPPKDKTLSVSLNDFVLRIKDADVAAKPSSAEVIAASLQKKADADRNVTVS